MPGLAGLGGSYKPIFPSLICQKKLFLLGTMAQWLPHLYMPVELCMYLIPDVKEYRNLPFHCHKNVTTDCRRLLQQLQ